MISLGALFTGEVMSRSRTSKSLQAAPGAERQLTRHERYDARLIELLDRGWNPRDLARKLGGNDPRKTRKVLGRIQRVAARSPELSQKKSDEFNGNLILQLPEMSEALARRAKRGRVDAIKLALEVTGVHNPRVKHEHSGDISISLNMPRPPAVENNVVGQPAQALEDGAIVDADVVEE